MAANNWYVITGGPSTGKTTLISELKKLGYKTVPEAARILIDEAAAKGISADKLRSDEKKFQEDVARLKDKIETEYSPDVLTFFDRGMHDTIAYMSHYGFDIADWIESLMEKTSYKKVFLLEPLATFHKDYARTEGHDFTKHLHGLLRDAYVKFGMEPTIVPADTTKNRLKFILDKIDVEQTA